MAEVLMEDLIDYNTRGHAARSSWTEQALDLFISILKNVKHHGKYSNQREMFEIITRKMSERNYKFSVDQIEKKYNSIKKMYTDKKERNQAVEPELSRLFGESKSAPAAPLRSRSEPLTKRCKLETTEDIIEGLDSLPDDSEEKKFLWSSEATKILLSLLEQLRPQLGTSLRTKKQMWEEICRRLKTHGYNFTPPQVENKWKALLRHYRGRLELMRSEGTPNNSQISKLVHNYSAWPEFLDSPSRHSRCNELDISFANDQKLPYDDDGYEEEAFNLDEIPNIETVGDEIDPVMVETSPKRDLRDIAEPAGQSPKALPSPVDQSLSLIVKELVGIREDNQKHQVEQMEMEKRKLRAYEERTLQFSRLADELCNFLKRDSDTEL